MIWDKIVGKILGTLPGEVVDYYKQKRKLEHDIILKKLEGKIAWEEAKTKRAEASEGRDHEWETLSIKNSGWKDEYVLIMLTVPVWLVFFPPAQQYVMEGFRVLELTPEWYRWLLLIILPAIYGIRIWRRNPLNNGIAFNLRKDKPNDSEV